MDSGADLEALVGAGVAVIVATRDRELRPELAREWGPSLSHGGERVRVCVEAAPGSAMARNLNDGSPVAATCARLESHTTVQLKGTVLEVRAPTRQRLRVVDSHVERFVAEGELVGLPEAFARSLVGQDLLDVTIAVVKRTDETPGPDAGRSL